MPRIRITEKFHWHPRHNVTITHKAGHEYLVTQACADDAFAEGKATLVVRRENRKPVEDASRQTQ